MTRIYCIFREICGVLQGCYWKKIP